MTDIIKPSPTEIRFGRLIRKIDRLRMALKESRELTAHYKKVLELSPNFTYRYDRYEKWTELREQVKALTAQVAEQAMLIKLQQDALERKS